jgi:hypothetical protein
MVKGQEVLLGKYKDPVHLKKLEAPFSTSRKTHRIKKRYCRILFILITQVFYLDDTSKVILVLETIEYYETSGKPGLVFIADFEKAFKV